MKIRFETDVGGLFVNALEVKPSVEICMMKLFRKLFLMVSCIITNPRV